MLGLQRICKCRGGIRKELEGQYLNGDAIRRAWMQPIFTCRALSFIPFAKYSTDSSGKPSSEKAVDAKIPPSPSRFSHKIAEKSSLFRKRSKFGETHVKKDATTLTFLTLGDDGKPTYRKYKRVITNEKTEVDLGDNELSDNNSEVSENETPSNSKGGPQIYFVHKVNGEWVEKPAPDSFMDLVNGVNGTGYNVNIPKPDPEGVIGQSIGGFKLTSSDVELDERDLIEQFIKGGGRGGQKVNKSSNCVVLTHIPTGTKVKCHATRDLHQNREIARKIMRDRLDELLMGADSRLECKRERVRRRKGKSRSRSKKKYEKSESDIEEEA